MSAARAGYVLAGGRSSRMGRDKALLPVGDGASTLIQEIAARVRQAAGNVTIVGAPGKYSHLGLRVIGDAVEGMGPLGGLHTALSDTSADWNLIVACDMPGVTVDLFERLFDAAERERPDKLCLVPLTDAGLEPLCAVYHRNALPEVDSALNRKLLKLHDFVRSIGAVEWPVREAWLFENINTPEHWLSRQPSK